MVLSFSVPSGTTGPLDTTSSIVIEPKRVHPWLGSGPLSSGVPKKIEQNKAEPRSAPLFTAQVRCGMRL